MIFLFLSVFFYLELYSSPVLAGNCRKEVAKLIKNWQGLGKWYKRSDSLSVGSTKKFGEWILHYIEKSGITLTKASENKEIKVHFSSECKKSIKVIQKKSPASRSGDRELRRRIGKSKGVIYLWSSHMPLSVKGIPNIKKAAEELNLKLIILQDVNSNVKANLKLPEKYTQKIESFELKMRNAYLHFPTVLVFHKGTIRSKIKYGYENKNGYKKDIKNIFKY